MNDETDFSVRGRTAVVTGGARGIGRAIAERLLRGGAQVIITTRTAEAYKNAYAGLSELGEIEGHVADLRTESDCRALVDAVSRPVDILVHNAGATWGAPLAEFPASAWDKVLDINVKSPFYLTRGLLPALEANATPARPSTVITIGSIHGVMTPPVPSYSYSVSKAAVHHLTRVLAAELGPRHITCNAVAPGPIPSGMSKQMLAERGEDYIAATPLRRIGDPDEVALPVLFLASPAARFITGVVLPVDGGMSVAP